MVDVLKNDVCQLLALTEMKGNGQISWCEVSGIYVGVKGNEMVRKGEEWCDKICVVEIYGPTEGDDEEKVKLWNEFSTDCAMGMCDEWIVWE